MKKKVCLLALTLLLAAVLSACGGKGKPSAYEKAVEAYKTSPGVTIRFTSEKEMLDGSGSMNPRLSGTLNLSRFDGEVTSASMEGTLKTAIDGKAVELPLNYYYVNGKLYAGLAGGNYCTPMKWSEALAQMGPQAQFLTAFTEADFKDLLVNENEDGGVTMSFIIPADGIRQINGITEQWSRFTALSGSDSTAAFQDVRGNVNLSKDGRPLSESIIITGSLNMGGRNIAITDTINMEITLKETADVQLPDLTGYEEIKKQDNKK